MKIDGLETNYGPQPIDALMSERGLSNADIVRASTEQLTFKMVQKARKGRRLTPNIQNKILEAVRTVCPDQNFALKDLFNY